CRLAMTSSSASYSPLSARNVTCARYREAKYGGPIKASGSSTNSLRPRRFPERNWRSCSPASAALWDGNSSNLSISALTDAMAASLYHRSGQLRSVWNSVSGTELQRLQVRDVHTVGGDGLVGDPQLTTDQFLAGNGLENRLGRSE